MVFLCVLILTDPCSPYSYSCSFQMKKSNKPDMPVIAGCLRGLGSTLVNFTQAVDEGTTMYSVNPRESSEHVWNAF